MQKNDLEPQQSNEKEQKDLIDQFWQTSTDFYQNETVKELLLHLQNKYNYSINRLLFSLWYSQSYQRMIDINRLEKCSASILKVEQSASDIRKSRQLFEKVWHKPYLGNINMARYHLLEGELSLEKEIQSLLVKGLCKDYSFKNSHISAESLDFLIEENIGILCGEGAHPQVTDSEDSATQQLSMLWIEQQNCYNPRLPS